MNNKDVGYTHTHTMEYYSAIKNEIRPFAATWMDLEMIILRKENQRLMILLYMEFFFNDTNELIYKTEMDSEKTNL